MNYSILLCYSFISFTALLLEERERMQTFTLKQNIAFCLLVSSVDHPLEDGFHVFDFVDGGAFDKLPQRFEFLFRVA